MRRTDGMTVPTAFALGLSKVKSWRMGKGGPRFGMLGKEGCRQAMEGRKFP